MTMDFLRAVCVVALVLRNKKNRKRLRQHKYWVHPLTDQRYLKGYFCKMYSDVRNNKDKFFNYYRMSISSFDKLLQMVGPHLQFQNTSFRKAISPEERLSVTLRYLATGNSFKSLYFEYLIGATTISEIVQHTCKLLWSCLQPIFMAEKTKEDWLNIAKQFFEQTHFPNCLGALDGKHVRTERPDNTGSESFNYKKFYSIILLAVTDANYCFIAVDVGAFGSNSDASVFRNSNFGKKLLSHQLDLPEPSMIPNYDEGTEMPFVFVADEAFPLMTHLMKPYPSRNLSIKQKVYNYRLSYARRTVECTFGIMSNKWRILHRPLDTKLETCDDIVKACCILHNFVRIHDGKELQEKLYPSELGSLNPTRIRPNNRDMQIRDLFADYFTSPSGALSWQYNAI